jgi:pimeloyl-ACP methyl ester carboxylesterase
MTNQPAIVLVHGAWGSPEMWQYVIEALPPGLEVLVADLPTCNRAGTTLSDDAAHVRELAGDRHAILVGHSYGGTVITEAGASLPNLEHLVYLAAPMPDVGESMFDWLTKRPVPDMPIEFHDDGTSTLNFTDVELPYDEVTVARLLGTRMRRFAIGAVMSPLSSAAWSTVPSTYVVATHDTILHPDTQREMAERAGAVTEIDTEHQVIFSHPEAVAALIASLLPT